MGMRKKPHPSTLRNTACKVDTSFLSQQMQQQTHAQQKWLYFRTSLFDQKRYLAQTSTNHGVS